MLCPVSVFLYLLCEFSTQNFALLSPHVTIRAQDVGMLTLNEPVLKRGPKSRGLGDETSIV